MRQLVSDPHTHLRQDTRGRSHSASTATKALSITVALLASLRLAWIVFSNGENTLSNDYGLRLPLVTSMLDGTCTLAKFLREAWVKGSHSMIAVVPIYYLNARLFDWSVWVELGVGLALIGVTLALFLAALPRATRWSLLPVLSLILFSTSRVTVLTFGEPALQYGLSQLGVSMAVFALARHGISSPFAAIWGAAGGLLASWSWGGGVMLWPVLCLVFILRREWRVTSWSVLLLSAAAALAQYAWLLPGDLSSTSAHASWSTRLAMFVDILGRPFVNGIADPQMRFSSQIVGVAGLVLLALLLLIARRRLKEETAPILLLAWALLVAAQIAVVRVGVAPWYASSAGLFWVGLVFLLDGTLRPLRTVGLLMIACLALRVQVTWEDKSFYLSSRSPAAAACLREWRTAPTSCAERLFQWGGGGAPPGWLAEPLEQRHLSVFGRRRIYLLQGDYAIGRASLRGAFFSSDGATPVSPESYHRLDLVLSPGAEVIWRVSLPGDLTEAVLETRLQGPSGVGNDRLRVQVDDRAGETLTSVFGDGRPTVSLDLGAFAGSEILIRFIGEGALGSGPTVLSTPLIHARRPPPSPGRA